jgi:hypothetical protein
VKAAARPLLWRATSEAYPDALAVPYPQCGAAAPGRRAHPALRTLLPLAWPPQTSGHGPCSEPILLPGRFGVFLRSARRIAREHSTDRRPDRSRQQRAAGEAYLSWQPQVRSRRSYRLAVVVIVAALGRRGRGGKARFRRGSTRCRRLRARAGAAGTAVKEAPSRSSGVEEAAALLCGKA